VWKITSKNFDRKTAIIIARPVRSQNRSVPNILEIEVNQISGLINMELRMLTDDFAQPSL